MVLVDTSVWLNLFRKRDTPSTRYFQRLLEHQIPYGITGVILQEILQGARSQADYMQLHEYLTTQRFYHPKEVVDSYAKAAALYRECRGQGFTIRSSVDCLIAQIAIEHRLVLLHDDRDFLQLAKVSAQLTLVEPLDV
ncbi:MAG: type II toxin-antitoxin system VapC family toxin [Methylococcales bacterium]